MVNYLEDKGIPSSQLIPQGFGKTQLCGEQPDRRGPCTRIAESNWCRLTSKAEAYSDNHGRGSARAAAVLGPKGS